MLKRIVQLPLLVVLLPFFLGGLALSLFWNAIVSGWYVGKALLR